MVAMTLENLRKEIDETDSQLLRLFVKRMDICGRVAEYKKEQGLPVLQQEREKQLIDRIRSLSPEEYRDGASLMFTQIMDISKSLQNERNTNFTPPSLCKGADNPVVACPGVPGSYSEQAVKRAFKTGLKEIKYLPSFSDVFEAVDKGEADYGMVALENSTAGEVADTYGLLGKFDLHIVKRLSIPVNHVLAIKPGGQKEKLSTIISHEQAIHQCSEFFRAHPDLKAETALNTSIAAKTVAESEDLSLGCICSEPCAELYGLETSQRDIADIRENYTRFICISKNMEISEDADTISACLSIPNTPGALYRLLTRFALLGINMSKIESRPIPPQVVEEIRVNTFDVIFYIDFAGSLRDEKIIKLLHGLERDMKYFRLLGGYKDEPI